MRIRAWSSDVCSSDLDQASPTAAAGSAATPIHSSHSPPLLTGRNGTVVTLIVADPSLAPAGANIAVAYRRRGSERSSGKLAGTNRARKRAPRRRGAPFTKQEPERAGRLLDPVTLHPLAQIGRAHV